MVSFQRFIVNCGAYSIAAAIRAGELYAVAGLLKDDLAPLMHMIVELRSEKDSLHRITLIIIE